MKKISFIDLVCVLSSKEMKDIVAGSGSCNCNAGYTILIPNCYVGACDYYCGGWGNGDCCDVGNGNPLCPSS